MTVRNPQLFQSGPVSDLDEYISDDAWALEQKVDGMRCLTVIKRELYQTPTVEFFTRGGRPLKSSAAKKHFEKLTRELTDAVDPIIAPDVRKFEIVLDAELMTDSGTLVILDMPYLDYGPSDIRIHPADPYFRRRGTLMGLYAYRFSELEDVVLVRAARELEDKVTLANGVIKRNLEGFIAKRLDAPYNEGERVSHSLKLKLTQTADVVVMAKNAGESRHSKRGGDKINYEFGVYDDSELKHIGNCSGIGKANAQVGDVIEVEYLYAGAGGKLVQPRMVALREDKWPGDCTVDQLKYVNKEVL